MKVLAKHNNVLPVVSARWCFRACRVRLHGRPRATDSLAARWCFRASVFALALSAAERGLPTLSFPREWEGRGRPEVEENSNWKP